MWSEAESSVVASFPQLQKPGLTLKHCSPLPAALTGIRNPPERH